MGAIGDPVGRADGLRREMRERVLDVLAPAGDAGGDVYVGWYAALDARACPARFRAGGDDGWGFPGWTAASAGPAIARAALHAHLDGDRHAPQGGDRHGRDPRRRGDARGRAEPLPEPLTLVRAWMSATRPDPDTSVAGWVAERLDARDGPTLAAAAANATRWMGGFLRALGWPLPARLALASGGRDAGPPLRWRPEKGSAVTVAPGADGRLGRVTGSGDFAVLVHRPVVAGDDRLRERAAFEAAAAALAIGVVPASVLVTAGDTGERLRVATDEHLLALGADLITGVVEQRVIATERGWSAGDATPSAACRRCPAAATCPPGTTWLAGSGRWRGGLPAIGPEPHDGQSAAGNRPDGSVVR